MIPILVHVRPFDLAADARVDVRAASAIEADAYGLGGNVWWPAIIDRPQLSIEIMSTDLSGRVQVGKARLTLSLDVLGIDAARRIKWGGASIKIYSAAALAWPAVLEFDGEVVDQNYDADTGIISFQAEASTNLIDKSMLTLEFDGSEGAGGGADLRGTLKPAGFGNCENIEPVWFDTTRNIGMIDGYGNCLSISRLMEGANDLGASVADYASYALLAAAIDSDAVPPGRWATCVDEGLVGLGAPPVGVIGVNASFGSARLGAMMARILDVHASLAPERIDSAAFAALDAELDYPTSYWTGTQVNTKDILEQMAKSANATLLVTFQRQVSISRAVTTAASATLDRSGKQTPRCIDWRILSPMKPVWRIKARAARPANVLSFDQVNYVDTLIDRGLYSTTTVYRAGNFVWLADGSQWLYTNVTAGAGHALPIGTAGDSYWTLLKGPTTAGDITYGDGTPIEDLKPANNKATRNVPAQLLQDGVFLDDYWTLSGQARVFDYVRAPQGRALEIVFADGTENFTIYGGASDRFFEFEPGRRLFVRLLANTAAGATIPLTDGLETIVDGIAPLADGEYPEANWNLEVGIEWFDVTPTFIGRTIIAAQAPAADDVVITGDALPPANAFMGRLIIGHLEQTGMEGSWAVWSPWIAEHQAAADITTENSPSLTTPPDQAIWAEATGVAKLGQFPRSLQFIRKRGNSDVTILTSWSIVATGCTASIDDSPSSPTRGRLTITAMDSPNTATVRVSSLHDDVLLEHTVKLEKLLATAPTPQDGTSSGSSATVDVNSTITSGSYGSAAASATVSVATGQNLNTSLALSYSGDGSTARLAGKWQYSPIGAGTWTDFGTEIVGTNASYITYGSEYDIDYVPGGAALNQTVSGLAAGDYDVRLLLRQYSGTSTNVYAFGTANISAGA